MKKLTAFLITLLLFPSLALAAGSSCAVSSTLVQTREVISQIITCTADDTDGSYPATTFSGYEGYALYEVTSWPGATAPTDASDITLTHNGVDILGGKGTNFIDATSTLTTEGYNTLMTAYRKPFITAPLVLTPTGNIVNDAVFYLQITVFKPHVIR